MIKKIVAFGASNSKNSINKIFAEFAAQKLHNVEIQVLDLNEFEMPIFSVDRERDEGIPELARNFKSIIKASDGIVISLAEHNGAYSAAFKNLYDWVSRIEKMVWENKPLLLLSTAPGPQGGKNVMGMAISRFQRENKHPISTFSLPSFKQNFSEEKGILNPKLNIEFNRILELFEKTLSSGNQR